MHPAGWSNQGRRSTRSGSPPPEPGRRADRRRSPLLGVPARPPPGARPPEAGSERAWRFLDSNQGHTGYEPAALPPELNRQKTLENPHPTTAIFQRCKSCRLQRNESAFADCSRDRGERGVAQRTTDANSAVLILPGPDIHLIPVRARGPRRRHHLNLTASPLTILEAVQQIWTAKRLHVKGVDGMRGTHVGRVLAGHQVLNLPTLVRIVEVTGCDLGIDINPVPLGAHLRRARLVSGLTLSKAAAGILRPEYLSLIELGRKCPSLPSLQAIATRVNCDLGPILSLPIGGPAYHPRGNAKTGHRTDDLAAQPLTGLDFTAFGAKLRTLRAAKGVTLLALAAGEKGRSNAFSRAERGLVCPTLVTLQRYADALGLSFPIPLTAGPLGLRLRRARRQAGLTLDAAGLDLGGRSYLRQIEQGERLPSLETLLRLADRLDLDVGPVLSAAVVKNRRRSFSR
jgi:transcriptional regulator with XRE-family HTH domain